MLEHSRMLRLADAFDRSIRSYSTRTRGVRRVPSLRACFAPLRGTGWYQFHAGLGTVPLCPARVPPGCHRSPLNGKRMYESGRFREKERKEKDWTVPVAIATSSYRTGTGIGSHTVSLVDRLALDEARLPARLRRSGRLA